MNIDPFDKYSEIKIWQALEQANMKEFVLGLDKQLLFECSEGGENLRFVL
jgi:ABC-type multidrug transport system fused ATPase/permease subunit